MEQELTNEKESNRNFNYKYNQHIKIDAETIGQHANDIVQELSWLKKILKARILKIQDTNKETLTFLQEQPPSIETSTSPYASLVREHQLGAAERLLLICSLAPHVAPELFTASLKKNESLDIQYPQLGGYIDSVFYTFVPTMQTVLHLLAGENESTAMFHQIEFMENGILFREQIVNCVTVKGNDVELSLRQQILELAQEYVYYFISAKKPRPDFGRAFPASLITTGMEWDQLVVADHVMAELKRIMRWAKSGKELTKETNGKFSPNFPCLFYGPSGTGKTLAAQLLGKTLGMDVFRVDVSMMVSKYIGETEKNLAYLFDRAEGKDWILFFDEADALFGKRTNITDSKDKWANLEMSYLLQRMEEYEGITVLATNYRTNIDTAMNRRFQSSVFFGRPTLEQRKEQWVRLLPEGFSYDNISIDALAAFDLSGGNIINVLKSCCLEAFQRGDCLINSDDLADAVKREFAKESRTP
jgi:ATPase family associated with various cellular activities (AAA)